MGEMFRRLLLEYAKYHHDERNCLMHIIGNPILAVAVFLPFSLLPVTVFGVQTNAAALLVIPALVFWMALDLTIGLAIVATAAPLLLAAALIAGHVSAVWVWIIAIGLSVFGWVLQFIGHKYFEGGWPALLDNPIHMLMSPMFVFAKLYVSLGLRPDLVSIVQQPALQVPHGSVGPASRRASAASRASSSSETVMTERTSAALDDMPGAYTRSKMRAEQAALAAARSGFPVVIANPTMPIGPHHGNLTPPALMLQHFARRRMQIYLDCRRGPAPRHGPRRGQAALYSRWRAHPVAASRYGGSDL